MLFLAENEILPTTLQKSYDTLTFEESLTIWERDKRIYQNSYTYLVGKPDDYTQIEVENGQLISRKHYSHEQDIDTTVWICEPNIKDCSIQNRIDSLRSMKNEEYRTLLRKYIKEHTVNYLKSRYFNCWEEYDFIGQHDIKAFPPKTFDELYDECANLLQTQYDGVHELRHYFSVNKEGYISSCYALSPYYTAHGEQPKEGFEIVRFQWKNDSLRSLKSSKR
ncbi:hypothetical protein [Fulvivirga sp.]|uniref:hypothetical protein n=1 Tax=Fulvivirga sp. TaxID=1931237 RepID=UPI0032EB0387